MTNDLNELSAMWLEAKKVEADAIAKRRAIEDRMKCLIGVPENLDGTETASVDRYIIKVVGRIDRKVDPDKLQQLAAIHGLTNYLSSLFRWKPEINMSAWKIADESITRALAPAITAKPGRASFIVTQQEQ